MGERLRSALCRPRRTAEAPTPTPAPTEPVPGDVARSIVDETVARLAGEDGVAKLAASIRAEYVAHRACASPSCPRRAATRSAYCRECRRVRREARECILVEAGWTLDPSGGGKRWIDPVTRESFPHATAVRIADRDETKGRSS